MIQSLSNKLIQIENNTKIQFPSYLNFTLDDNDIILLRVSRFQHLISISIGLNIRVMIVAFSFNFTENNDSSLWKEQRILQEIYGNRLKVETVF